MTSISSVTAISTLPAALPQTPPAANNGEQPASVTSPASVVILGEDTAVSNAEVYSPRGLVTRIGSAFTWEKDTQDKVTQAMAAGIGQSGTSARFQGLGSALLEQLSKTGASSISQSVLRPQIGGTPSAEVLKAQQSDLRNASKNNITLTLQTASGATVSLSLAGSFYGLSATAEVTGGELSETELAALGELADSFQGAIDGLSAKPPRLDLGKLAQLDPNIFSSVDLSANLENIDGEMQTLSFQSDSKGKSVDMSGATGNVQLSVSNNATILGSSKQQAAALKSYLEQFDAAQKRGNGDQDLMNLFKDAFSTLNGAAVQTSTAATNKIQVDLGSAAQETAPPFKLNDLDHALLTGLADFKASITQTEQYINPMRPGEVDKFSYEVSQATLAKGSDQSNRSVEQNQTAQLSASYHKPLGTAKLELGEERETQNYLYYQIEDSASSSTKLVYDKGARTEASLTQSASQLTTVQKYVMGVLEEQTRTPVDTSETKNLLSALEDAVIRDRTARKSGTSTLENDLLAIHSKILLHVNPADIS